MSREETEAMATMCWVFHRVAEQARIAAHAPIQSAVDVERRRARLEIPGLVETVGEPIRNPVTGAEHGVQVDPPEGFKPALKDTYVQFAHIHFSNKGVVE
jgi:hypothetical protein